jgi:hypothetical protein
MDTAAPAIAQGAFRAFFVYDVADTIDLAVLQTLRGAGVTRAPLQLRREASSEFIQYPVAPLIVQLPDLGDYRASVRAKIFDFGVVSIRISVPYSGPWTGFAALGRDLRREAAFEAAARATLDDLLVEIVTALVEPHAVLVEDYFVFDVDGFTQAIEAGQLTRDLAGELGQLLLFEEQPLGIAQQEEALRVALSYYPDDLVVVQWDAAFVYDRPSGSEAIVDILEYANAQLVEFRTYDARLDEELDAIYALEPGRRARGLIRRREQAERADRVRFLLVDILELTDRTSNALKVIGDAYYARLYRAAAGRLGLADWQAQIDAKLRSVSEIYRVLQDQAQYARSEFLEIVIIALIAVEAIIGIIALRH